MTGKPAGARPNREGKPWKCAHCDQPIKWCDNPNCPRITHHLIHVGTGIGACRGNRTTAMLDPVP
jgi:hypothetical protein